MYEIYGLNEAQTAIAKDTGTATDGSIMGNTADLLSFIEANEKLVSYLITGDKTIINPTADKDVVKDKLSSGGFKYKHISPEDKQKIISKHVSKHIGAYSDINKNIQFDDKYTGKMSNIISALGEAASFVKEDTYTESGNPDKDFLDKINNARITVQQTLSSNVKKALDNNFEYDSSAYKRVNAAINALSDQAISQMETTREELAATLRKNTMNMPDNDTVTGDVTKDIMEGIKAFETKAHDSEESIITDSMVLNQKIDNNEVVLKSKGDLYSDLKSLVQEIAGTKLAVLKNIPSANTPEQQSNPSNLASHIDKSKPSTELSNSISLPLGEVVTIKQSSIVSKADRASYVGKVSKSFDEAFGYEPQGNAAKVLDKYQATRDLIGSTANGVLRRVGAGKAGEWFKAELLQKPGEVNPQVIDLEQKIRNAASKKKITTHDTPVGKYKTKQDIDNERDMKKSKRTVRESINYISSYDDM